VGCWSVWLSAGFRRAVCQRSRQPPTGLWKQEDPETLTRQTAAEQVVIPQKEIQKRTASQVSFMPEGILQKLSDEQVRDLLGYLQGPTQVPLPEDTSDEQARPPGPADHDG
jgi:hypothetical protein